ncbi:MAG: dTDP-4-dehydrorhamnose 3,5-epimerase family protein [Candidatus Eisenbacteria bacterium]
MTGSGVRLTAVKSHAVIRGERADEKGLIRGVVVRPLRILPDDRGHFAEILRASEPIAAGFEFRQASLTRTRAGVIKAFHYHELQDDIFCPVAGTARIVLVDFREGSKTRGVANSVFAGALYPKAVRIPAGVAHGYEVLPGDDLLLVYFTNREYDPDDEHRLAHDDPRIGFAEWGVRNR